jgi:hypothetical protein
MPMVEQNVLRTRFSIGDSAVTFERGGTRFTTLDRSTLLEEGGAFSGKPHFAAKTCTRADSLCIQVY